MNQLDSQKILQESVDNYLKEMPNLLDGVNTLISKLTEKEKDVIRNKMITMFSENPQAIEFLNKIKL